jgi:hypothetical protein
MNHWYAGPQASTTSDVPVRYFAEQSNSGMLQFMMPQSLQSVTKTSALGLHPEVAAFNGGLDLTPLEKKRFDMF